MKKIFLIIILIVLSFMLGRYSNVVITGKEVSLINPPTVVIENVTNLSSQNQNKQSVVEIQYAKNKKKYDNPTPRESKKKINDLIQRAFDLSLQPKSDGDFQEVVDLYDEILLYEPENEKALEFYSNYLVMQQELDLALPLLKKCIGKYPQNELCNGNLANYYLSKNKMKELEKSIATCLINIPKSMMCLFDQGQYYLRTRQYEKSLEVFQRINRDQDSSTITYSHGVIAGSIAQSYEGLKNKIKAKEYHQISCHEVNDYSCKWVSDSLKI